MANPKLSRNLSVKESLEDTLSAYLNKLVALLCRYVAQGNGILRPHNLIDDLGNIIGNDQGKKKSAEGHFGRVLKSAPE